MTTGAPPTKEQLVLELTTFCQEGYLIYRAKSSLQELDGLVGLRIVGGPNPPESVIAWDERREALRSVLTEIAKSEVKTVLGKEYSDATLKLFRLDVPRAVARHVQKNLNDLQDDLLDGIRRKTFVDEHRPMIFEVVAEALIQREQAELETTSPDEPDEPEEESSGTSADAEEDGIEPQPAADQSESDEQTTTEGATEPTPEPERPSEVDEPSTDETSADTEPAETKPSDDMSSPTSLPPIRPPDPPAAPAPESRSRRRRPSRTAGALILVISLIAVAAVALLAIRIQSPRSEQPMTEAGQKSQNSKHADAAEQDVVTRIDMPSVNFTAEVVNWCYCGDPDTLESQIKIKPRLVNHSARRVDLRTGGSARMGLAIYARASSDRSWITPTEPRYRRYGKWLVVPPNAPGDLVSTTRFETHWEPTALRPFGEYLDPDHYEGDLVFNVPPDLSVGGYRVRLAYRLGNGDLYFPRKGAAGQWHGYRKEGSTF